jgi:hypothetical protein
MRRCLTLSVLTVTLIGASALPFTASSASADPLCYSVSATGVVTYHVGPACVSYPYSVACFSETAGLSPTQAVNVKFCTP